MDRLIVVANRLPIEVISKDDGIEFKVSPGGLVRALSSIRDKYSLEWFGWPGEIDTDLIDSEKLTQKLKEEFNAVPIFLKKIQANRHYLGFSNKVLWPILHYLPSNVDYDLKDWEAYKAVNKIFADKIIEAIGDDENAYVWIHDYQLMLVPAMIREKCPNAKIGFFLHIPFTAPEVFKAVPHRDELLTGLLGSNLIGFHTYEYLRQFRNSLLHILGIDSAIDRVDLATHSVKFGVYPVGVDVGLMNDAMQTGAYTKQVESINNLLKGRKLILGVDRLDYTKGLIRKFKGIQKFLRQNPEQADGLLFLQIAVPSRIKITSYRNLKDQTEELIAQINEEFEHLSNPPVVQFYRSFSLEQLTAFYKLAKVMLVTPLRDGMNLVAKEYVAVQKDEGALILGEFAGAAGELGETCLVNPFDTDEIAESIKLALALPQYERKQKMQAMYQKVLCNDIHYWADSFISDLKDFILRDFSASTSTVYLKNIVRNEIKDKIEKSKNTLLMLDYDGTLVALNNFIHHARPNEEIKSLLNRLSGNPKMDVAIVTGRTKSNCDDWFKGFPLILSAEHGLWIKWLGEDNWYNMMEDRQQKPDWYESIHDIFRQFSRRTPGAFIEEKDQSIAWHFRLADKEFGILQSRELVNSLTSLLANKPAEIVPGNNIIEVRLPGVNKGNLLKRASNLNKEYDLIIAIGDDVTDEDMFTSLPNDSYSIKVGKSSSKAKYYLNDNSDVKRFLNQI
jgi:trehalose 6-phosphate synthase/phosphatase